MDAFSGTMPSLICETDAETYSREVHANKPNKLLLGTNSHRVWHIRLLLSCCHWRTENISHYLHFSPFSHERLVSISIVVFKY